MANSQPPSPNEGSGRPRRKVKRASAPRPEDSNGSAGDPPSRRPRPVIDPALPPSKNQDLGGDSGQQNTEKRSKDVRSAPRSARPKPVSKDKQSRAPQEQAASTQKVSSADAAKKAARKRSGEAGRNEVGRNKEPQRRPKSNRPVLLESSEQKAAPTDEEEEDLEQRILGSIRRGAPSWLVSLIVHLVLIIILGLLTLQPRIRESLNLDAIYAEEIGEQLEDMTFDLDSLIEVDADDAVFSEADIPVEDPFSAMPELTTEFDGSTPTSNVQAPQIGNELDGREEGMKMVLLAEYGGTESTEEAVRRALLWLKKNQRRDGSWSLKGPFSDGVYLDSVTAATAMALLAFQGAGNTHESGEFKDVVARGWNALLERQSGDGDFYQPDGTQGVIPAHHLYSHAQATIAICELYGMTKDEAFREPAIKALRFAEEAQSSQGGWRYEPGVDADLSVTGWFVMAFQSARMAGLPVTPDVLEHTKEFLRSCDAEDGIRFIYKRGHDPSPEMTAEAMLCWEYLGWERDNERLNLGARHLLLNPVDWEKKNFYYWYYATQALHHMEGDVWTEWNEVMRQVIPSNQVRTGREAGSWDPDLDPEGVHGGRLYATCMCVYVLEVYYRHLPIYSFRLK